MTKVNAIAKKSGKEFEVVERTELTVVLKDIVTGEEKEIKVSTYLKGYQETSVDAEVEEDDVPWEVKSEESVTEAVEELVVEENAVEDVKLLNDVQVENVKALVKASSAIEELIAQLADGVTVEMELKTELADAIRQRDNNRQCYKENENRFRNTLETYPDDEKFLHTYVEKMVVYYKKYLMAKVMVGALKAQAVEDAKATAVQE